MLKKIYKWAAVIISAYVGIKARSFREMFYMLFYFLILYAGLKIFFGYLKRSVKSAGGPLRWLINSADTTRYGRQMENNIYRAFQSSGSAGYSSWDAKREADQRVRDRTKAQNDAVFYQNIANQNRGNYDGYRSQNFANNARNRANRY